MKNKRKFKKYIATSLIVLLTVFLCVSDRLMAMPNDGGNTGDFTAVYEDSDVKINITANEGVLPTGAELSVTPIKKTEISESMSEEEKIYVAEVNEQYDKTSEKLNNQDKTVEGFLAYDISFFVGGEEVEPNGNVEVVMEFQNAVKPIGVSDDAVPSIQHLRETETDIVLETLEKEDDVIDLNENSEVEKVSLQSDSFSIFTITWNRPDGNNEGTDQLLIKLLDKNNKEINLGLNDDALAFNKFSDETVTPANLLEELAKQSDGTLDGWAMDHAYILINGEQKNVEKIKRWGSKVNSASKEETGGFQASYQKSFYDYKDWNSDSDGKKYLYFVLREKVKFTPVETIDSAQKGITMKIIDYFPNGNAEKKQFTGADYNENGEGEDIAKGAKPGILSNTLGDDGYPTFLAKWKLKDAAGNSLTGESLSKYFRDATGNLGTLVDANHLFLRSVYNDDGHYYYYDSGYNAASFDAATGDFDVYEELVTSQVNNIYKFRQRGNFFPFNTYVDPLVANTNNLYAANGDELPESDPKYQAPLYVSRQTTKFSFGMEVSSRFIQDENGYTENNPMRYEFTGDDDLWVYIDGVLVLDIGGSHDAREGYIDFSTGEVYVQGKGKTTIKKRFEDAGKADDIEWKSVEYTDSDNKKQTGYIFSDYTSHEFKMWYMERGGGASNLRIKFNLPVIPQNQIQIRKELGDAEDDIKSGNVSYGYKLYALNAQQEFELVTNTSGYNAKLQKTDGDTLEDLQIDENGIFKLKPGEAALFDNISKYYVKEVDIDTDIYDKVTINGEQAEIKHNIAKSEAYLAKSTQLVTFRNYPKDDYLCDLAIEKTMKKGQVSTDTFDIQVKMEGIDGNLTDYKGDYILIDAQGKQTNETTKSGIIKLKADEKAIIKNILAGTAYSVQENLKDDYGTPIYTLKEGAAKKVENGVNGTMEKNKNTVISIENRYARTGTMTLLKVDKENPSLKLKGVRFEIFENETSLIQAESDKDGVVTFDISKLKEGHEYILKETTNADGYLSGMMVNGVAVASLKLQITEEKEMDDTVVVSAVLKTMDDKAVESNEIGYVIQNLKDKKISIDVEKKWEDKDYVNRPSEIKIQLYRKKDGKDVKVENKSLTLTKNNQWKGTFTDLPYWDEQTKTKIEYSVKEDLDMVEYQSEIKKTETQDNKYTIPSFTITNKLLTGKLIIDKEIVGSEVNPATGDPVFTFEVKRKDGSLIYYRTIRLHEILKGSAIVKDLPYGEYVVTEMETLRYVCVGDLVQQAVINEENKTAVVKFQNKLVKEDLFSHTDVIENRFRIGDDGKVSITQDKLLDNTSDFNLYRISQNVLKAVEKEEQ